MPCFTGSPVNGSVNSFRLIWSFEELPPKSIPSVILCLMLTSSHSAYRVFRCLYSTPSGMIFLYFYEKSEKFLHVALNCTEIRLCAKTMFPDPKPNAKTDRSLPLLGNTQGLFKKLGVSAFFQIHPTFSLKQFYTVSFFNYPRTLLRITFTLSYSPL